MKLVSFSLWGNKPKYNVGAVKNAYLVQKYYPGWISRFYVHEGTDQTVLENLRSAGSQVILIGGPVDWNALFWRFNAVRDEAAQIMISRDCDSRIDQREVDAVEAWIQSTANLHIMRDHPLHSELILGGMWGAKRPIFDHLSWEISNFLSMDTDKPHYGRDQEFLRIIYKKFRSQALVHDDMFDGTNWPGRRDGLKFVGQIYDESDNTATEYMDALKYAIMYRHNMNYVANLIKQCDLLNEGVYKRID